MSMEFIVPSLRIFATTNLTKRNEVTKRLEELMELEEDRFIARFHQNVQKDQQKEWHDRHIKAKEF